MARFIAETTAFNEAVVVLGSIPTPQKTSPSMAHSRYAAALASPPAESASVSYTHLTLPTN